MPIASPLRPAHSSASRPAMSGLSGFVGGVRPVAVRQVASRARVVARPAINPEVEPNTFQARLPLTFSLAFLSCFLPSAEEARLAAVAFSLARDRHEGPRQLRRAD